MQTSLMALSQSNTLTMSSREIALLLEKPHSNIKISAERLAEKRIISTLALQEFTHNGNTYTEYLLNKRDSLVLVAQNSPEFTARIVDRWQELESQQAPQLPQSFAQALRLAAEQAEIIEQQQTMIEHQKPAVEFVERYVQAESEKGIRQVGKLLGWKQKEFTDFLVSNKFMYRLNGVLTPYAQYEKYFTGKTGQANNHAYVTFKFTPEGIAWIAEKVAKAA